MISVLAALMPQVCYGAGGGFEGRVLYRGENVPGAYVEVFYALEESAVAVEAANTGSDGRFALSLPPGSYRLTVKKRPEGAGAGGMLFGSTGADPLVVDRTVVVLPAIQLRDMGAGEGVAGEITVSGAVHRSAGGGSVEGASGEPLSGAYVYFYPLGIRQGPGYLARARSGERGRFRAGLSPGSYMVTVRFGASSDGMGTVSVDDLVGDYPSNPLEVGNQPLDLGRILLRPVDPGTWERKQWARVQGDFTVTGVVVKEDRSPMPGAYVFLYDDRRMVGKPVSISAPTDRQGRYSVAVSRPGSYYLGARTRYGGPVEPGEFMGAWDEKGPRPVVLDAQTASASCTIVVREVW